MTKLSEAIHDAAGNGFELFRLAEEARTLEESLDSVYTERAHVVAALSKLFPAHMTEHEGDQEPWDDEWTNVVCIHLPTGQVTWHISKRDLHHFGHLLHQRSDYDGHDTPEKYRRLDALQPEWGRMARVEER